MFSEYLKYNLKIMTMFVVVFFDNTMSRKYRLLCIQMLGVKVKSHLKKVKYRYLKKKSNEAFLFRYFPPAVHSSNRGRSVFSDTLCFGLLVQKADTVKMLSTTQRGQDDLLRAKQQLEAELEALRQEKRNLVRRRQVNARCRSVVAPS